MSQSTDRLLSRTQTRSQIFNVQVSEEENVRLLKLAKRVSPSNKAEVFRLSLKVLEHLVRELDEGAEIYVKRIDDEEPVKFDELLRGY